MTIRSFPLTLAGMFLATGAFAQVELTQQDSQWFTDGESRIDELAAIQPNTGKAKNVILFIADGNGVGTNYATRLWVGQQEGGMGEDYVLPQEAFPNLALVKTYTTNGQTPDSAPTASAMNTGVKSRNGTINVDDAGAYDSCDAAANAGLTTFSEIVSDMGKSVGVVTTARVTHATPAAVYAKTANRDWEDNTGLPENCAQKDIAAQLVDAVDAGTVDFVMGGGRRHFLPNGITDDEGAEGRRTDDRNLIEEIEGKGWQYVWNSDTASQIDNSKPVLGLFEASHMQYEEDRDGEPTLAEMTEMAINNLSDNDDGFYLQVEAGRVDHANHAGNLHRAVTDGAAFADAIEQAVSMVDPEETLIIVTADHEHAIAFNGYCGRGTPITGLCYQVDDNGTQHTGEPNVGLDGKPYTAAGYLNGVGSVMREVVPEEAEATHENVDGQAETSAEAEAADAPAQPEYTGSRPDLTQEEATDVDYLQQALIPMTSETHSGEDVALMANGPWSHLFRGVMEQNMIFHVMNYAVNAE
ncbi:alkaline phosphatase [Paracoccus isoporae]|uniref:Alkaline phosphatase n=1 Tax=Paracoccus isoporae TaxID=591205 RepID=A0A1G6SY87_9RHOB|nr:alkaline phosphatase [Paracoccus isoporae]SDD21910.1 alkaline phosphatase [Paracoccus isoporae]